MTMINKFRQSYDHFDKSKNKTTPPKASKPKNKTTPSKTNSQGADGGEPTIPPQLAKQKSLEVKITNSKSSDIFSDIPPRKKRGIDVTLYLSPDVAEAIEQLSTTHNTSKGKVVDKAIRHILSTM